MRETGERGVSQRERLEVAVTALVPAALGLLAPLAERVGRLAWLAPVMALPFGVLLCPVWQKLGEEDLGRGLERAFGRWGGKAAQLVCLLWGLCLLTVSAGRYKDRLSGLLPGEAAGWLYLLCGLAVALWLGRGNGGTFARTGRVFFLATAAVLGFALLLAVPALEWRNLWPLEGRDWSGLPVAGGMVLSLSGYGVYVLCLPRRTESRMTAWPWTAWACGVLAALLLAVVGTFGPQLTARMGEPFLYLMEGVEVPGAFRRGEAAVAAALTLADLVLLTLLTRGCGALWEGLAPAWKGRGKSWMAGAAFWVAGMLAGGEARLLSEQVVPVGNLAVGVFLPALAILSIKLREKGKTVPHLVGQKGLKR